MLIDLFLNIDPLRFKYLLLEQDIVASGVVLYMAAPYNIGSHLKVRYMYACSVNA